MSGKFVTHIDSGLIQVWFRSQIMIALFLMYTGFQFDAIIPFH